MILTFLGDSITAGVGASSVENRYVEQVGKMLNCTVYNCGIGGTRIARRKNIYNHTADIDFNARAWVLDQKTDYLFVFGGTNDHGHGDASLGDYESRDVYTFYGAMRTLIDTLTLRFNREKIRFILPCKKADLDKPNPNLKEKLVLKDFVEAEKKILEEYKIPYLNLFDEWVEAPTTKENSEYFIDGLHPNDNGHREIAKKVCEFIAKTCNK